MTSPIEPTLKFVPAANNTVAVYSGSQYLGHIYKYSFLATVSIFIDELKAIVEYIEKNDLN